MISEKDRVLIIDGCIETANILADILRTQNIEAHTNHEAGELPEANATLKPTIIIVDSKTFYASLENLQLPNIFHNDIERPLILALIGNNQHNEIENIMKFGFDNFIVKPSCWDIFFRN